MPKNTKQRNASPLYWSAESWAVLSLRLFLSLRFLTAGLGKFHSEENGYSFSQYYNGFASYVIGSFESSALPGFLVSLYAYTVGYLEIVLGLLLLLGVKTKYVLALTALTYVSLAYGKMVQADHQTVAFIGIHLMMTAAALYFVRHNKLELLR